MAKKICPSDFKNLITIQNRALNPDNTTADFNIDFTDKVQVWAGIKTTRGQEVFGDVNTAREITHIFTIRYIDYLTQEYWILFKDKRYDILDVENIDERNKFMRLRCNVRGSEEIAPTSF